MGEGGGEGEGGGGGEGGGDGWPASSTSTCYPRQGVSLGAAEQDLAWVKPGARLLGRGWFEACVGSLCGVLLVVEVAVDHARGQRLWLGLGLGIGIGLGLGERLLGR